MLRNMTSIYIKNENKMLMVYRIGSAVVQPSWCGIGGHFQDGELNDPETCVLRELFEETGITIHDISDLELKYVTIRLKNNELRQYYYFFANLKNRDVDITNCPEGRLEWLEMDKLLEFEMPFTAKECLKHYLTIGEMIKEKYAGVATDEGVNFVELKEF